MLLECKPSIKLQICLGLQGCLDVKVRLQALSLAV